MNDASDDQGSSTVAGLFHPDLILPDQYYPQSTSEPMTGERALQWAVFADGIERYRHLACSTSTAGRRELTKLKVWVSRSDWDWLYSFATLCVTFGFDPSAVRGALGRMEQGRSASGRRRRFRHAA